MAKLAYWVVASLFLLQEGTLTVRIRDVCDLADKKVSRQQLVWGSQAQKSIERARVVVWGVGSGIGSEVVKNLLLTGVKQVLVYDTSPVELKDLSAGIGVSYKHIGLERGRVLVETLKNLLLMDDNRLKVLRSDEELHDYLKNSQSIIVINKSLEDIQYISSLVERKAGLTVISCKGAYGYICNDFNEYTYRIDNHLDRRNIPILEHLSDRKCLVIDTHQLKIGDEVEVGGEKVKVVGVEKSEIELSKPISSASGYIVKNTISDVYARFPPVLETLQKRVINPASPSSGSRETLDFLIKGFSNDKKFARANEGELAPVSTVIGAIGAHETLKYLTKSFSPLEGVLVFAYPGLVQAGDDEKVSKDRYYGQRLIISNKLTDSLRKKSVMIAGSGAIGCEILKLCAQLGIGSNRSWFRQTNGGINIVDSDTVESSNLSRQLLFNPDDVGKQKATAASIKVRKKINNQVYVHPINDFLHPKKRKTFSDNLFKSTDVIFSALDNYEGRVFIDTICADYTIPFFDSATQGSMGSNQVIIPFQTESYQDGPAPPSDSLPVCTVRGRPLLLEHSAAWATDLIPMVFDISAFSSFLRDPHEFFRSLLCNSTTTEILRSLTVINDCGKLLPPIAGESDNFSDWEIAHKWAIDVFNKLFSLPIGTKKEQFPDFNPIKYDPEKEDHVLFVELAVQLRLKQLKLDTLMESPTQSSFIPPNLFKKRTISTDSIGEYEKALEEKARFCPNRNKHERVMAVRKIRTTMREISGRIPTLPFGKFEPNKDTKDLLVKLICAGTILRAKNYNVPCESAEKVFEVAGKIVPALITTTALSAGLTMIEFLKSIKGDQKVKNHAYDMHSNKYIDFDTSPPHLQLITTGPYKGNSFSNWDRIKLDFGTDVTLQELIQSIQKLFDVKVTHIVIPEEDVTLYSVSDPSSREILLSSKFSHLLSYIQPHLLSLEYVTLAVYAEDVSRTIPIPLPFFQYRIYQGYYNISGSGRPHRYWRPLYKKGREID